MNHIGRLAALSIVLYALTHVDVMGSGLPTGPGHDISRFGPILPAISEVGVGPAMSVDIQGNYAYVVGRGVLSIVDIGNPDSPRVVGSLKGLGITRQIAVRDKKAYIASRGDGLYIIDVIDAAKPLIMVKHDTIEFATGIALGGDVAFVACRPHTPAVRSGRR